MKDIIRVEDKFYILTDSSLAEDRSMVLKYGEMFVVFGHQGNIRPFGFESHGLYYEGTRFLSRLIVCLNGKHPLLLSSATKEDNDLIIIDSTNPDLDINGALMRRGIIHLFRSIFLKDNCYYEKVRISNYGLIEIEANFSYEYEADYADIFEVRGLKRERVGRLCDPMVSEDKVILSYEGLDGLKRKTCLEFSPKPSSLHAHEANFLVRLAPHQHIDCFLTITCLSNIRESGKSGSYESVLSDSYESALSDSYESALMVKKKKHDEINADKCIIETSNVQFNEWLNRSSADLFMMLTETPHGIYPYAGVPWFSTVFGRDGLITALESLWIYPKIARGVLAYLASHQAKELRPEQDAEPGKILHEERKGEMANLGEIPFGRYYGSVDSTLLFLILAGYYFDRTADLTFIENLWPSAELALAWIDQYGDADKDGFIEYKRKSIGGLSQQGWKDSDDSVFHHNGDLADPPIALCEVQGYAYEAKLQAAKLANALGKKDAAKRLITEAKDLQRRFLAHFWCEEIGMYALALDGNKKPCCVRSSNAGHCLFTGIARQDHAHRISDLLTGELFSSGWGIRTIASSEVRYNPMSYHNGSIWPHDNALIAHGISRYGFKDRVVSVLKGLFDASLFMDLNRLPELYCGFMRRPNEGPTLYPVACIPQSWASAAVFMLLQSCLGLHIDGLHPRVYFTKPALPDFLQEVRIRNLKVGSSSLDVMLHRHPRDVSVNVLHKQGAVEVLATL